MKPDKCQSTLDGICNLPIGTCTQCEKPVNEEKKALLDDVKEVRRYFKKGSPLVNMLDAIIKKHESNG